MKKVEGGKVFATGHAGEGVTVRGAKKSRARTDCWGGEGEGKDHCRFVALSIRNCYRACRL